MERELDHMEDGENMMYFAIQLIIESRQYRGTGIMGERVMILHLDHANELLMKSFLIKKGYIISYLEKSEVNKGIKKKYILDNEKNIDYGECLNLVCKNVDFSQDKRDVIMKFHRLRNEIQHRATNLPLDKKEKISEFYPYFKELYNLMFPEFADAFPKIDV